MALLDQVKTKPTILPPRIVIHGKGGVGKTTFGASAPGALLMPVEDGLGILQVAHLPRPDDFNDVMQALTELRKTKHEYKTLVIDSLDHVEPLIWAHICEGRSTDKKTYDHIEDFGYGKGYTFADEAWVEFFQALDGLRSNRKMWIKTFNDLVQDFFCYFVFVFVL